MNWYIYNILQNITFSYLKKKKKKSLFSNNKTLATWFHSPFFFPISGQVFIKYIKKLVLNFKDVTFYKNF